MDATPEIDATRLLPGLRTRLQRYADAQVHDAALAQDAVSETLLAALQCARRFETEAQATGWVFGVLKHKLMDQLRQRHRERPAGSGVDELRADELTWSGGWRDATAARRGDPEAACERLQWAALIANALDTLPPTQRRAFVLREVMDLDTARVCRGLDISENHLWVLLHRARMRLRRELHSPRYGASSAPALMAAPGAD